MTDREILDALHNVREFCIPGMDWTDDVARLALAEFDRAVSEIKAIIKARDALLYACLTERSDLAADQSRCERRIAWLDATIAKATKGSAIP
jgi:hypothetical protein